MILVAYATKKGSTREVAEAVASTFAEHGLDVEVLPAAAVRDLERYDAVVLGTALYTGRVHADARAFLRAHREALAARRVAVFAMGPRTLAEKEVASSRKQLDHELAKVPDVHPDAVAVFGGVLDPSQHRFPFNRMPASDARDWSTIAHWADALAASLAATGDPAAV